MLRCKHVADALARVNFHDLRWIQRTGLLLHVFLCPCCGRYHRDVIRCQDQARRFRDRDDYQDGSLSDTQREAMTQALRGACQGRRPDDP